MGPVTEEPRAVTEEINLGGGGVLDTEDVHMEAVLTGLGPLKTTSSLCIKQKIQTCEILTGCEQENRFTITGPAGDVIYWAKEHSTCLQRFLCGNVRSFDMTISDQTTNEVIRLYRPLTCQGCCCSALYPHCTQALTVSVNGETVGTVRERATWWNPVYHVFDSVGNQVLKIRGPWCHFALCDDVIFKVLDTDGSSLASIAKKWKGCLRETLTDADNFEISFNEGLSTDTKVLVLGATFLIDMMYFEMSS